MFLTAVVTVLAACATPAYNYVPEVDFFSAPPLNERTVAAVGDRMLAQGQTTEREALRLNQVVKISGYTMTPGFYPKVGEKDGSSYFSYSASPTVDAFGNQLGALQKNLIVDPPQSIEVVHDGNKLCVITIFDVHTCRAGKSFGIETYTYSGEASFQQTLYYNGRVGDRINIGYREYSGDMARPAFSNEVEYDLSVSDEFSYKGAKILVHEANNNQIEYTVLQNFRGFE
ncbi:MAG: hypothetical protein GYB49_13795 [Alphaproteobacteria bacterium]|nr:hypothetical protein [Alphaproteobacteria bacterium]